MLQLKTHHYIRGQRGHSRPSRRSILSVALVAVAAWLTLSSVSVANNGHLVQLYVDNGSRTVLTQASTVKDVLDEAGVSVSQLDLIEPALNTPIAGDDFHINVYRARPVMIIDGDKRYTISTPYSSPQLIARSAGLTTYPEDRFDLSLVENFVEDNFIGQKLTITRAKPVDVDLDGQTVTFRVQASDVKGLLAEKGIVLGSEDFTDVPLDTPVTAGMHIRLIRVGHEVVTEEKTLAFDTRTILDSDMAFGQTRVEQEGHDGRVVSSYEITRHNGREVSRSLLGSAKVDQPVMQIVVKGTRILEPYETNDQILAALRECETHGNYQANTGNGYYGAYQFLDSTWDRWNTGYDRADHAPAGVQDATVLKNVRASSGGFWSQHPGCSSKYHLPKFPF